MLSANDYKKPPALPHLPLLLRDLKEMENQSESHTIVVRLAEIPAFQLALIVSRAIQST